MVIIANNTSAGAIRTDETTREIADNNSWWRTTCAKKRIHKEHNLHLALSNLRKKSSVDRSVANSAERVC